MVFFREIGGVERQVVQQALHDGVQAARADVLHLGVDLGGDAGDLGDGVSR